MGKTHNYITFYRSYRDALGTLPDAERLKMYDAIMDYAFYWIEPELDNTVAGMFMLIKADIDAEHR
jgi:hypothetical protein